MNYKMPLAALVISACSCDKKPPGRYPYLNAKMNEETTISHAELQARAYETQANGSTGSFGQVETEQVTLFEDRAQVTLGEDKVTLRLNIRISGFGYKAHEWMSGTSEEERVNACKKVCFGNIRALASSLSCNPELIEVDWSCSDGRVQGHVTGKEATAAWASEQVAPSKGP